jgi:hypothetical protein
MNAALTEEEGKCDPVSVSNRYFGPWAVSLGWQLIRSEKVYITSLTFAKVRFSSLNFKTGQNTSVNF